MLHALHVRRVHKHSERSDCHLHFKSKIGSMLFIMIFALLSNQNSFADCPDKTHICRATGDSIAYGTCFGWSGCKPCRKHDWGQQCHDRFDRSNWMSNPQIASQKLADITLPGAHDAGMGVSRNCSSYAFADVAQTQGRSILQLLRSGVRVFDIRPTIDAKDKLSTGHFSWVGRDIDIGIKTLTLRNEGCFGYDMNEVMNDIARFRSRHPGELIILDLSHFQNFKKYDNRHSRFDHEDFVRLKNLIEDKLGDQMIRGSRLLLDQTVDELVHAGGVLVVFQEGPTNPQQGYYAYRDIGYAGSYANKSGFEGMRDDQFAKLIKRQKDAWFVTSWTLTQQEDDIIECAKNHFSGGLFGTGCQSILSFGNLAMKRRNELSQFVKDNHVAPNVIYTDAATYQMADTAIELNLHRSGKSAR